ncbi:MAG: phosphodiester glycosidase family protein [Armatimonadota bacterium]
MLTVSLAAWAGPKSVTLHYQEIMGFPVKFVAVNMKDPDVVVTTAVASRFPRGLESWGSFINRVHPDAAINGTYFCQRTFMPVGDVAVGGNLLFKGVVGTGLCITADNKVAMLPGPRQGKPDWSGFSSVLCAGPRLLTNGQVTVNARAEGFRDPRVLGSATRSAVAYRATDGLLFLITIEKNISLQNLAYVCKHLGATDAMTLDGGSSSGMYAQGRTITRPERGIGTAIVVYSTQERYRLMAERLVPANLPVIASLGTRRPLMPLFMPGDGTGAAPMPMMPASPFNPAEMKIPGAVMPPIVTTKNSVVRLAKPDAAAPVQGTVPVTIEVMPDARLSWISLRINDHLRAMGNTWPLVYQWDSTKETDGVHTLEVIAWSEDRTVLERDIRQIRVQNSLEVAVSNEK